MMGWFQPKGVGMGRYQERGSRFLAFLYPMPSEEALQRILQTLHQEHPKAKHICWAYSFGDKTLYHEAKEPKGSVGPGLAQILETAQLRDTVLVVVRYFGGTKLGLGNLARAYRRAGEIALANTTLQPLALFDLYNLTLPAQESHQLFSLLNRFQGRLLTQSYQDQAFQAMVGIPAEQGKAWDQTIQTYGWSFQRENQHWLPVLQSKDEKG